jgi:catechol 2,3-dioxygenase-like lactoylglutathione lyase family enzyme
MKIEFITGFAVIAQDAQASRNLYVGALGLPLRSDNGGEYFHSGAIAGSKHFGIWPLAQASQACFGKQEWPAGVPVPQVSIEFEVAGPSAVEAAARELQSLGYTLLHGARTEPWGQTVARLLSPESLVVGISYAPALH